MNSLHQKLAIMTLLIQLVLSNISNIQFNMRHQISHTSYSFAYPIISKVQGNYLYVSQTGQNIRKISLIAGTQQGVFVGSPGSLINDFIIVGNCLTVCYSNQAITSWNVLTFLQFGSTQLTQACQTIVYLQDVNRFLISMRQSQKLVLISIAYRAISFIFLNPMSLRYKFCLSSDRKSMITIKEDGTYQIANFSYTASFTSYAPTIFGSKNNPSFVNRVFLAKNVPFTFYLLSQSAIHQLTYNNGSLNQYNHLISGGVLLQFKQIANDRVAYVADLFRKKVNFIGKNNFSWQANFAIPENITGLQTSSDNRLLILICQTQIRTYQISCLNSHYYDPTTFDCLPCDPTCLTCQGALNCTSCSEGKFMQNSSCKACDISCLSCDNGTGCVKCASGMQPIGIGLPCQPILTDSQNQANYQTTFQKLIYFLSIPSALKIPIQSSVLILISDFWIYSYHNRTYGQKVNQVFQLIRMIEDQKWALAKFDEHLNISLNPQYLGFSNYSNYSNPKFLKIQNKSSTFIESMSQFFAYFMPVIILVFLLYRFIFCKTFDYRISRHFRKYSFNYFIVFLLTEGNFQYICYCCFNQSQMLYFCNFIDKINAWIWAIFFFLATIHAFGGFYITYWIYDKLSNKFIDEAKKMLPSFAVYTIMTNGKNFVIAGIQSLLFKFYTGQMFAMIGVDFLLIGILLYCQIRYGMFKRAIFFNYLLLQTTVKILINFLFLIQHTVQKGDNSFFDMLEDCLIILLYIWSIIIIFGVITSFFPQTKKIKRSENANEKKQNKQKCKQQKSPLELKLNDEIVDGEKSVKEKKIKQKSLNANRSTQNRLRFANRQDIVIFEYVDQKSIQKMKNYKQRQQKKRIKNVQKAYNQRKIANKQSDYNCKKIKRNQKIHNFLNINFNGKIKNNENIQEIIFDFRT